MKKKHNEGFSLVEVLVSITVLALIVIPVCSGLILSFRMNAKTDDLMQAQLAVSSAVETLMAEGIPNDTLETKADDAEGATEAEKDYGKTATDDRFPDVTIKVTPMDGNTYYTVVVTSDLDDSVSVTTSIRAVEPKGGSGT